MRIYFIRHGETVWNTEARLQGKSDTPLNEKGIALARITGQSMADIPFDVVYSSPLKRALHTAELVLEGREVPFVIEDRIEEIGFGPWEGLCCRKDLYELPDDSFKDFFGDPLNYKPPVGGETIMDVCARTEDFLKELIERDGDKDITVMISCHGCTLRALMNYFYQEPENFWRGHVPPNCGVTIVDIIDGKATIVEEDKIYYDADQMIDFYER